jgi:hypothetical protein
VSEKKEGEERRMGGHRRWTVPGRRGLGLSKNEQVEAKVQHADKSFPHLSAPTENLQVHNVMYNAHTRKSCGFAFVTISVEEAEDAITALNATELMGKSHQCRKGASLVVDVGQCWTLLRLIVPVSPH